MNDDRPRCLIGMSGAGIEVTGATATGVVIRGNYIGTDSTGAIDLGNNQEGVAINDVANATIGATTAGAGNVISANAWGVCIAGTGTSSNLIAGNAIGTGPAGTESLGNTHAGVVIYAGAQSNRIGGSATLGNRIRFNQSAGVMLFDALTTGNRIQGNSMRDNSGLGIDSGGNGSTTIASAASTPSGTPIPERISDLRSRLPAVAAMRTLRQNVGALTPPP